MRWADSRFAILGWVPVAPRFDRPLHALQSPGDTYQIVKTESGWVIADHIVKRLQLLENNLCYLANTLAAKTDASIPLECEDFPRPSAYGYSGTHKTYKGARISAMRSRDAFFPLVAWCSFVMSSLHNAHELPALTRWEDILHQTNMPPNSIQEIKQSELVDFSPGYPRAGIFVDYNDGKYEFLARAMVRRNIPVCFFWGNSLPPVPPILRLYYPTSTEVVAAFEVEKQRLAAVQQAEAVKPQVHQSGQSYMREFSSGDGQTMPPSSQPRGWNEPDPLNGQLPRETWKEYFARMDKIREKVIAKESERSRQQRLDREKANSKRRLLGRKAPPVFRWEEDETTGQLVRKRVDRSEVEDLSDIPDSHWRYNSITNEFDICAKFDPDAKEVYSDYEDDIDAYEIGFDPTPASKSSPAQASASSVVVNVPSSLPSTTASTATVSSHTRAPMPVSISASRPPALQQESPSSVVRDGTNNTGLRAISAAGAPLSSWQDPHVEVYKYAEPVEELEITETLTDILRQRFGFLQPISQEGFTANTSWPVVRKIYGDIKSSVEDCIVLPASHFQESLLRYLDDPYIQGQLWDLAHDSNFPLRECANANLRVVQRNVADKIVYFIESRRSDIVHPSWHLMLEDAATVLECFRREEATLPDIVEYLVSRGRPFSTRIPRHLIQLSQFNPRPGPLAILGSRTLSQPPTLVEYRYYEDLRAQFFRRPHSRAAFLRGGILWRLGLESTGRSVEALALDGPSYEALDHGNSILLSGFNEVLWDDDLSESESDLICGVYKIIGK